ncbi:hypothetical protein INR49_003147 [Caranx melampygus]|nr:hypothetical protein INR49_003147 [Caranx melampygus]
MGPEKSQSYQLFKTTLERNKVPMVVLSRDNFSQHIPNFNLAEGDGAVVDVTAGVLYADRALKTVQVQHRWWRGVTFRNQRYKSRDFLRSFFPEQRRRKALEENRLIHGCQSQFQKLGGVIRDQEKVMDIKPGPVVTVSTSAGVYRAKRLVITAGPWVNRLLSYTGLQLPLECLAVSIKTAGKEVESPPT